MSQLPCACHREAQECEHGLGLCLCPCTAVKEHPACLKSHCTDTRDHAHSLQSQLLLLMLHNAVVGFPSGVKPKAVTARSPTGQSCPHCCRSCRDAGCRMWDACLPRANSSMEKRLLLPHLTLEIKSLSSPPPFFFLFFKQKRTTSCDFPALTSVF